MALIGWQAGFNRGPLGALLALGGLMAPIWYVGFQ